MSTDTDSSESSDEPIQAPSLPETVFAKAQQSNLEATGDSDSTVIATLSKALEALGYADVRDPVITFPEHGSGLYVGGKDPSNTTKHMFWLNGETFDDIDTELVESCSIRLREFYRQDFVSNTRCKTSLDRARAEDFSVEVPTIAELGVAGNGVILITEEADSYTVPAEVAETDVVESDTGAAYSYDYRLQGSVKELDRVVSTHFKNQQGGGFTMSCTENGPITTSDRQVIGLRWSSVHADTPSSEHPRNKQLGESGSYRLSPDTVASCDGDSVDAISQPGDGWPWVTISQEYFIPLLDVLGQLELKTCTVDMGSHIPLVIFFTQLCTLSC